MKRTVSDCCGRPILRGSEPLKATTPENNELSLSLLLPVGRKQHWHNIRMHTLWSPFSPVTMSA